MQAELRIDLLIVTAMLGLRLAVTAALLPLVSGRSVPVVWRLAVAGALAFAIAPVLLPEIDLTQADLSWSGLAAEALRSLIVGLTMSFVIGIPFAAVRFAGQIIGMQVGFSLVNTLDPQGGAQLSVLANVYYIVAVLLFFTSDAHHILVGAMTESCRILPIFSPLEPSAAMWLVLREFSDYFRLGLIISAPVVAVLLLVSAAMGFIVKTVPQINILIVGFPVKLAVGLAMFGLSLVLFGQVYQGLVTDMEAQLMRILTAFTA